MPHTIPTYSLPRWALTRWLARPGADVPREIAVTVIGGLFTSSVPLIIGALSNAAVTVVAVIRHPGPLFYTVLAIELALLVGRLILLKVAKGAVARGARTPTDLFIASSVAWAALVGVSTALCVATRDPVLQLAAPTQMLGMLVGLVTRNLAAPRLAITQVVLADMPINLVFPFSGDPWLMLGCVQFPMFLVALISAVRRLNRTYLSALLAERESAARATHDVLTGLRNRSGFMTALGRAFRPRNGRLALSLLYVDLDGFKAVNDTHGHGAGDDLLRQVAERISATVPDAAVTARLGGDEFVVLLPETDAADAQRIGIEVIAAVSRPYDLDRTVRVRVGASIGVACAGPIMTPETLLAEADAALYRSKAAGKGRCVLAGPVPAASEPAAHAA